LKNPERDREKGLGLGLAIVQRLVKILGAKIELKSKPGQGTRFSLYLQATQADLILPKVEGKLNETALLGLHVMAIDDDKIALESLNILLSVWDCSIKTFASEEEALQTFKTLTYQPDVLIVDYRLQGKQSGVDAIKTIRRYFKRDIPALIITGDTAPERIIEAKATGLPLLHKPVDPNALKRFLIQIKQRYL
jgi:CheY-like chemotaxis protein